MSTDHDTQQVEKFLTSILGDLQGNACLGLLGHKNNQMQHVFAPYPDWLPDIIDAAMTGSAEEWHAYFTPALYKGEVRRKAGVADQVHALWADLDACPPDVVAIRPSIAVQTSPGRFQGYWLLSAPMSTVDAENLNRRIAYAYRHLGADVSGWPSNKLLRIPGTANHKYNSKPLVEILWFEETRYEPADFAELPEPPKRISRSDLELPDQEPVSDAFRNRVDGFVKHLNERIAAGKFIKDGGKQGLPSFSDARFNLLCSFLEIGLPPTMMVDATRGCKAFDKDENFELDLGAALGKHPHPELTCQQYGECPNARIETSYSIKPKSVDEVFAPPSNPMEVARQLEPGFTTDGCHNTISWRGDWLQWKTTHYEILEDAELRAILFRRMEHAKTVVTKKEKGEEVTKLVPWAPTITKIANLTEAFKAIAFLPSSVNTPSWFGHEHVETYISCENGLVNIQTREQINHNIRFFNLISVPFKYDSDAPAPNTWLEFLASIWPESPNSIQLLQEWFGYVLSGRTDFQKMLYIAGPKRSGKGTLARVLMNLTGMANVVGPTFSSLCTNFGLAPLIGKSLAVVDDARFTNTKDANNVVERLLTISGEGVLDIDRKYKSMWTGQLATRIMMMSNELPRFKDSSGVIASRFMVLNTKVSFYGREDKELAAKLNAELTGILNWALDGLDRLLKQGKFTEPEDMQEAMLVMEESASPLIGFVRECCVLDSTASAPFADIYEAYRFWALNNNMHQLPANLFSQQMNNAFPELRITRPRVGTVQVRTYQGIRLAV